MLLEDVIKNTPDTHPDKSSLKEALEQIDNVAWHINEQLREHENNMKVVDIQKSLAGGFPKIIAPGRKLLKQGNLMKVPRTGGNSGQPRYFVLFSDMIMYCKIKTNNQTNIIGQLVLPKSNALECGCMLPLKHCKVENLVGKGVFKLSCQREELILYSIDGAQSSEEWVDCITKAITKHKTNSATLRKESSRREPIKRPDIMKMRRESLGQILLLRKGLLTPSRHKMILRERNKDLTNSSPGNSPIVFSPRSKKRPIPMDLDEEEELENNTPKSKTAKVETPKRENMIAPPPVANVQLRAKLTKKINRSTSAWKTLSLSRRDKVKNDSSQIFRSPSIYENKDQQEEGADTDNNSIMTHYLSGKICPLTPSQEPTNVDHLVETNPKILKKKDNVKKVVDDNDKMDIATASSMEYQQQNHPVVPISPSLNFAGQPIANYCSIM